MRCFKKERIKDIIKRKMRLKQEEGEKVTIKLKNKRIKIFKRNIKIN
jgi:hypothetical protein